MLQILWRFTGRFDLQMLVQLARGVVRGTAVRLVAAGERNPGNSHPVSSDRSWHLLAGPQPGASDTKDCGLFPLSATRPGPVLLFLQRTHVSDHILDLCIRQFAGVALHCAFAVLRRVEQLRIGGPENIWVLE